MKFPPISAFASIFFAITTQLFAGSQPDIIDNGSTRLLKRKESPTLVASPSKKIQREKKTVRFDLANHDEKNSAPSSERKISRFTQDQWDNLMEYNDETGAYHQFILKKDATGVLIKKMDLIDIEAQFSSRWNLLFNKVLPDSEWEYAFSILEYAFGLTDNCDERMEGWNDIRRDSKETSLVWNALRFHFNLLNNKELINFMANLKHMKDSNTRELQESKYYGFQATHTLFEEALNPEDKKEFDYLALSPDQRHSKSLVKKVHLLNAEISQFEGAARKAKAVIQSIILTGLFGDESYQTHLVHKLKEFYIDGNQPRCLFMPSPEYKKLHLRRFVIALKQYLFRFINPEEQEFIQQYETKSLH